MPRLTIVQLEALADQYFPDNNTGQITPAQLRDFLKDFLNAMRPAYAILAKNTPAAINLTPVFQAFPWNLQLVADAPDYTVNLPTGEVTKANGPAVARIEFSMDFRAANNVTVTFALFVNGVESAWAVANTATGVADVQSVAMTALVLSASPAPVYQIRVKSSGNNAVTLSNGVLTVENVPVNAN